MVWCGLSATTDQRSAMAWLRTWLKRIVRHAELQPQPHDHVLDSTEPERETFENACFYVRENPVRRGLVGQSADWKYTGAVVPGYPQLHPKMRDFWGEYWKLHRLLVAKHAGDRRGEPPP